MSASDSLVGRLISELSDAALELVLLAGPGRDSVDLELAIGRQVDAQVKREFRFQRFVAGLARSGSQERFLGGLADAVYQIGLEAGSRVAFDDLELGIWNALCRVAERAEFRWLLTHLFSTHLGERPESRARRFPLRSPKSFATA